MQLPNIVKPDGYKYGHFEQYRPGTEYVSSYIEARGCDRGWKDTVFAGLQYYLKEFQDKPLITSKSLERMKKRVPQYGTSFNAEGFQYLLDRYDGFVPLRIQALEEGSVVPVGTPLLQVVNEDPKAYWATSLVETPLLRGIWYPTTVATLSFHIKRILREYMLETAGHTDGIDFKLHDFGARGVSSGESAQIGGYAHLTSFMGSDTFEAIEMISEIYDEDMAGYSVNAAEHSTVTSFGGPQYEFEAYQHLFKVLPGPNKIFSIVSDTYNIFEAVSTLFGQELYDQIVALGSIGSKFVIRPDSGDPVQIVSDIIERLMHAFGYTINQKGYKVLPPYLGVLQGDGINEVSIRAILEEMKRRGLSAENIVFGMGGALLQGVNRDTLKFAMKASAIRNGQGFKSNEWYGICKDPITDKGKRSKIGRQAVFNNNGQIFSVPEHREDMYGGPEANLLIDHYANTKIKRTTNMAQIRQRVAAAL